MVPINNVQVDNHLILGKDEDLRKQYDLNLNSNSFGSSNSFDSFGSMGTDEAIMILNPCDYTI
jgi:hypothetical protein